MKRILSLLAVLCLLLCACGNNDAPATTQTPSAESTATPTTEPITEPTTEPVTEPTEPPILYRHPYTGVPLEQPFTGRATAVVVNNIQACLPQYGIADADMIYELETESGITRFLALYTDLNDIPKLGPVRSTRTFFCDLALSNDAPLIHCGGSAGGLAGMRSDSEYIENWEHINEQYNGSYFFRDKDRYYYQGYNWEHTLFTSGELLQKGVADKGFRTENTDPTDLGYLFDDEAIPTGEAASTITVTFRGGKTTTMTYNTTTGLYEAAQYGDVLVDANTEAGVSFRNVLVLHADQWKDSSGYRSYYELLGTGDGYFACNGQIVTVKWSRESGTDPFTFTLSDGTPLTMGVGTSYVGIISLKGSVVFE